MKKLNQFTLVLFIMLVMVSSCKKSDDNPGKISLFFMHSVQGTEIEFDTLKYVNAAGNPYLVNEIQYFVSDVTLYRNDGSQQLLDAGEDIHYVDTDLPETWTYTLPDEIQAGNFDSVSFTFGINEEKNQSLMFVNPPESNMFWPELLGGGYHYMKLNGKWLATGDTLNPFNFHMGRGQVIDTATGEIIEFVPNFFRVSLPSSAFSIAPDQNVQFILTMDVQQWFENPHTYDFNVWGGKIMQNQAAMQTAKENGHNVFSIKQIYTE